MQKYLSVLLLLLFAAVSQSLIAQQSPLSGNKSFSVSAKNVVHGLMNVNHEHQGFYNYNDTGDFGIETEESENISSAMEASFRLKVAKLDGQVNRPAIQRNIQWLTISNTQRSSAPIRNSKFLLFQKP